MRHIIGLVAASIAAPHLVLFLGVAFHPSALGLRLRDPARLLDGMSFPAFNLIGLISVTIPILFFSALIAIFLDRKGWHAWWQSSSAGMMLGTAPAGAAMLIFDQSGDLPFMAVLAISGAICGWIYWAIASRKRPDSADATPEPTVHSS